MIRSLSFTGMIVVTSLILTRGLVAQSPNLKELVERLGSYERSIHGLSFAFRVEGAKVNNKPILQQNDMRMFVSRNGRIRSWEGSSKGRPGAQGYAAYNRQYAGKASADEGWVFNVSKSLLPNDQLSEVAMSVVFYPPRTSSALARGEHLGFIDHLTFAEYANESQCTIALGKFADAEVWELTCDHPTLSSTSFYFDRPSLQLVGLSSRLNEGDLFGAGALYMPPRNLESGQWISSRLGPIAYVQFAGRSVPFRIPYLNNSSEPNSKLEGVYVIADYALLENDLTTKIEFDSFELPEDGERVTSQGEEGIRYELRQGRVVKVIDSDARRAAASARFYRSGMARKLWFIAGSVALMLISFYLVRRWSLR